MRFCENGNVIYCDNNACNCGIFCVFAGQADGKTGGINHGNAPDDEPVGFEPRPPAD